MPRRLRIAAISYLNTAPLMWDFEHGSAGAAFDISYTTPSQCAAALELGSADIGIIPAAAYASIPGLVVLPDIAIAAQQAVRSILLVSKKPIREVRSVALDRSSLTSVALTKVLFSKWLGPGQEFTSMPPDLEAMLAEHDAGLLIGDPALQVDRSRYITLDLAEEWIRFTGKPFVFAFWAVREAALKEAETMDLAAIFQQSRDNGLKLGSLNAIARSWGPRLHMTEEDVRSYLTQSIHFKLDAEALAGLGLFYKYAAECKALPSAPPLRFHETPRPVTP